MQIQEIVVEKFGKLEHQYYQLHPGWQAIYGTNEAGKSTLYYFILSILYGFKAVPKQWTLEVGDGGYLIVEAHQELYKIERYYKNRKTKCNVYNLSDELVGQDEFVLQMLNQLTYDKYQQLCSFNLIDSLQTKNLQANHWHQLALAVATTGHDKLRLLKQQYQQQLKQLSQPNKYTGRIEQLQQRLTQLDEKIKQVEAAQPPKKANLLQQIAELEQEKAPVSEQEPQNLPKIEKLLEQWRKANWRLKQYQSETFPKWLWALFGIALIMICLKVSVGLVFLLVGVSYYLYWQYRKHREASEVQRLQRQIQQIKAQLQAENYPAATYKQAYQHYLQQLAKPQVHVARQLDADKQLKLAELKTKYQQNERIWLEYKKRFPEPYEVLIQQKQTLTAELNEELALYQQLQLKLNWLQDLQDEQINNLPQILQIASDYFSQITQNKYQQIIFKHDQCLVVDQKNIQYDSHLLSTSAKQQLLLALKLAFVEYLNYDVPLLFDDVWQSYDNERKKAVYQVFNYYPKQIITFTFDDKIEEYTKVIKM